MTGLLCTNAPLDMNWLFCVDSFSSSITLITKMKTIMTPSLRELIERGKVVCTCACYSMFTLSLYCLNWCMQGKAAQWHT